MGKSIPLQFWCRYAPVLKMDSTQYFKTTQAAVSLPLPPIFPVARLIRLRRAIEETIIYNTIAFKLNIKRSCTHLKKNRSYILWSKSVSLFHFVCWRLSATTNTLDHMQILGSTVLKEAKEAKMKEKEVAAKSRNIQVTILQWQWSPAQVFLRNL